MFMNTSRSPWSSILEAFHQISSMYFQQRRHAKARGSNLARVTYCFLKSLYLMPIGFDAPASFNKHNLLTLNTLVYAAGIWYHVTKRRFCRPTMFWRYLER